ncbi:FAD dependent oxidoreductase [Mycolicibacterium canariasense]|uniref:FAD dependent oxidoreductase n=1 Tax=Mycolicibacterium canariasense TaxID=228230 RepID=A0A100WCI7_MYCCR|nr:FAD-dependent oxidoreductase [Mycolicibacterium canariasense]MCV7207963.1 FAD-dependent oxidoreductase [Mycolicibacterium canariasense]GAS95969.1 FAD dependent oxidoreductase [Mycolicibacterium canariasense]
MSSLWTTDRIEAATPAPALTATPEAADVIVVGAGLTGLTTAVLLARAGKRVTVVEARHIGAGATGNTTGKVTLLQGSKLARLAAKHGTSVLEAYVAGNKEGRDWLLRHCADHGLSTQREDDHAYAQTAQGLPTVRAVFDACRGGGLDPEWLDSADVPFPFAGGVRLRDQAQIDPIPFLDSLVVELETHGGTVLQGVRATSISGTGPLRVDLRMSHAADDTRDRHFSVTADRCVLATGTPILDRGGFFARLKAQRSYCMAFDVPGDITRSMYISVDSPTRSVRYAPSPEGDKLIVAGAGHPVGRGGDEAAAVDELARWAAVHYPGAVQTHRWSAQDYHPAAELPYVGPLLPKTDRIFVATGFDKWGMTNGVAAALALSARILGGRMDWAQAFGSWSTHELAGLTTAVKDNVEVGINLAKGWLTPVISSASAPHDSGGAVTCPLWRPHATSVVDGSRRTVSAVCPHLGGIVGWNNVDQAWECPLHGSRFAPDGSLLEGTATKGLSPIDDAPRGAEGASDASGELARKTGRPRGDLP